MEVDTIPFTHSCIFFLLVGSLLALFCCAFIVRPLIRWYNATAVTECPHCQEKPTKVRFYNHCSRCGCEYDMWGKITGYMKTPAELNDLNLTRFEAKRDNPNPPNEQYQPGASQELIP